MEWYGAIYAFGAVVTTFVLIAESRDTSGAALAASVTCGILWPAFWVAKGILVAMRIYRGNR